MRIRNPTILGRLRLVPLRRIPQLSPLSLPIRTLTSTPIVRGPSHNQVEGAEDISHATFISSASSSDDYNPLQQPHVGSERHNDPTKGRLSPTSSHLFKLILPLPKTLRSSPSRHSPSSPQSQSASDLKRDQIRPTAFLLHPSQPLSHLSRLIAGSLPPSERNAEIEYLALTGQETDLDSHLRAAEDERRLHEDKDGSGLTIENARQEGGPYLGERQKGKGRWQEVSWSQSTDLSDFIKQSCLNEEFKIVIRPESNSDDAAHGEEAKETKGTTITVVIPSFASRTTYLRNRLLNLTKELERVTKQKKAIDMTAHKSAQRLGTAALTVGGIYWGAVVYYTFFTESGWDLMEPFTWTIGYAALLGGCGFLVYHNREVSYSSLLDLSITARQHSLYTQHGLDIDAWTEMVSEAKTLRREIARIAKDYDIEWKGELENLAAYSHPSALPRSDVGVGVKKAEGKAEEEGEEEGNGQKIDIDKTIDEASEMAERTKEKQEKSREAERKGEVVDERREEGRRKRKQAKEEDGDEDEEEQVKRGSERAREVAQK